MEQHHTIKTLLVILVFLANQVVYSQNSACLSFTQASPYSSGAANPGALTKADLDGDGDIDLAVAHETTNNIGVLMNNGNGSFAAPVLYSSGGSQPNGVASADLNGDGLEDLAVSNHGGDGPIAVLLNNGSGIFAPAVIYAAGGSSQNLSIAIGDFNGDGKKDLTVTDNIFAIVSVLINNGDGTFGAAVTYSTGGGTARTVRVSDLNEDGHPDLVLAVSSTNSILVLKNNGNGTFAAPIAYPAGDNSPSFIAIDDYTTDGHDDVAVSTQTGVAILLGNGNSTLSSATIYAASGIVLSSGDVNGDGVPDLAMPALNSSFVQILVNSGDATFSSPVSFHSGGAGSHTSAISDFDADGKNDIAVTNFNSGTVGVLINTTSITAPTFTINAPIDPVSVNSTVTATISHSNSNLTEAVINWGDGTGDQSVTVSSNAITASHPYNTPGVYTVTATLRSCYLRTINEFNYVVVYDPAAGFVTGGGYINSPAGAYVEEPSMIGTANFGFVSKYQKGQSLPTGNTQFQFQTAGLDFKSSAYEWLAISGAKAQFKGSGTINGTGNYGYLLSAIDGALLSTPGTDKFRIKIWNRTTNSVIYDNQPGAGDNADATTNIAAGSIVIHKPAKSGSTVQASVLDETNAIGKLEIKALPNPTTAHFELVLKGNEDQPATIRIIDMAGRLIELRSNVKGNAIRFGDRYQPGAYLVEATRGAEKVILKVIKTNN